MHSLPHSLFIFPQAGPDIKYLLGFIRTQLSTSVTVVIVFGPKVLRVLRGQGDQWDHRARVRGITASFSHNGIGLVPEESPDLYQENEELKVRSPWIIGKLLMEILSVASSFHSGTSFSSYAGRDPETGRPGGVHAHRQHGDEQPAREAQTGRLLQRDRQQRPESHVQGLHLVQAVPVVPRPPQPRPCPAAGASRGRPPAADDDSAGDGKRYGRP